MTLTGATASADLGGSSDYSSVRLEGLSGEGFRVQVSLPRLSRPLEAQAMLIWKVTRVVSPACPLPCLPQQGQ